jgi:hypothetical protein
MIDNREKTAWLLTAMAEMPILTARLSPELKAIMREKNPSAIVPDTCTVSDIIYTVAKGGITCKLDVDTEAFVS